MTTAVLDHSGDCWSALSVRAMKSCSSSGSELPGWPSSNAGAFRNETAGRLPAAAPRRSRVRSYWWLAWSVVPIMRRRRRRQVVEVRRRRVVLERLVVRDVVADVALATLRCVASQVALPVPSTEVGLKPPWNQPQVMLCAFSRSPTFLPRELDAARAGAVVELRLRVADDRVVLDAAAGRHVVPCVWPLTRLIAPSVDGPKLVPKELSLIAKCCARFHSAVTVLPS